MVHGSPAEVTGSRLTCIGAYVAVFNETTETEKQEENADAKKMGRERTRFCGTGIISPAFSLVKEALMQTYTDSSEPLKEGHKKVTSVSHSELVKTKPLRIPKGILDRLLYLKLHWQPGLN